MRVGTAVGSELVDLPVPMRAEYYASAATGFVGNGADTCATNVSLAFPAYTESLNPARPACSIWDAPAQVAWVARPRRRRPLRYGAPPLAGDFNLRLAAPGAGNQGSVLVRATVPPWLRFDWNTGAAGDENPTGQATFGIFGGERRVIYTREIY